MQDMSYEVLYYLIVRTLRGIEFDEWLTILYLIGERRNIQFVTISINIIV